MVSGWDTVDEILEDELELAEEFLHFVAGGEDAVVFCGEVELFEDFGHVVVRWFICWC